MGNSDLEYMGRLRSITSTLTVEDGAGVSSTHYDRTAASV